MTNEPERITEIRRYDFEMEDHIYDMWCELLEYIDQLQGLLDGKLMVREDKSIVDRVHIDSMSIGDTYYMPVTYRGFQDKLIKDIDDETL